MSTRIRLGISSCLLGQKVRYDGGHRHNAYITRTLGRYFEFVPLCPEVAIGMGAPRPPIRLVKAGRAVRARGVEDPSLDVSSRLRGCADAAMSRLRGVSGYILKSRSPSCGMQGVPLHDSRGKPVGTTSGLYAERLMELLPALPCEEDERLMDPVWRENFIERVFVYHRWQQRVAKRLTPRALVEFHTRHKFIALAHDEKAYRALGRRVAAAGKVPMPELEPRYIRLLMQALTTPATRTRHANVLQHIAGFFKHRLDAADRHELQELIANYRRGRVPRIVPVTLIRHTLRRFPDPVLAAQHYLAPHPDELMLGD
jgi:uncharacterized protein YbgA (DUF1722 family)/uncharacterized protein YbbK (DUF523 family)